MALTVSVRVISNSDGLLEIEDSWDSLVGKHSENPLCLSGFIKQFMEFHRSRGWTPLLLAISADNAIVGIAPLITKKKFGIRFVKFLSKSWLSPDFIVGNQYRQTCIAHTLRFLFNTLRCQLVDLTLPAESSNLPILKQKCKAHNIHFFTRPDIGHCIIPVEHTWDEYKTLRGRNFRRKFKKIERNLDRAGSWRITCVENRNKSSNAIKKILDVERMSWKAAWRTRMGLRMDKDLLMIWKGSLYTARTEPDFKWNVWFLELNDQTLAYSLVLQYKEVAFIIKTSYDERYKRFYPGVHVINAAIRGLFKKRQVRSIDFLMDLPFHRTWTSICLPRVRVMMAPKGVSSNIMGFVLASKHITKILNVVEDPLSLKAHLFP